MQFAEPLWLLAGAIVCALLVWQYRRADLRQRAALAQFASARLLGKLASSVSTGRRLVKRILFTLGVALLFVALARPQAGFEWQEAHRKGLEIVFAVDTSKSMLSQDVKPDRLTRAKMAVTDLVGKLDGDAVGLIAFAGDAFLQCPITLDYDAFRECVDALDTNVIPRGGTDIASAIHEAEAVFKTRSASERVLVLMTDGEDLGGEAVAAAQEAAKQGVKIYTVGIGSADGALIPLGGAGFVKDDNGNFVKSHLDEATLKKMAEATGGLYEPLGARGEGLDAIYQQGLSTFAKHDLTSRQNKVPLEKFYWAVVAALACFVSEMLIGTRKNMRAAKPAPAAPAKTRLAFRRRPAVAGAAVIALLAGVGSIHAATPQAAEQDYQKGDFAKSQREYADNAAKTPADAQLRFNTGSAAYKAGDYAAAASAFHESLKTDQVPVQEGAYYNLGNTEYRLGEKTAQKNPQETIKTWEGSLKSYDAALQLNANDADAKHNRDLVQRKLDQLKKQEEQKKQQQQQQQQKNKDDRKQDQKNKQDQQKSQDQKKDGQKDSQNQAKNGQDSKDQKSQGQSPKDQQAKDQSGKDQQAKSQPKDSKDGQEPKDSSSADQNGQEQKDQAQQPVQRQASAPQPQSPPSKADAKAANPEAEAAQQAAAAADQQREPGQMTREEARQLLDSLKGEEQRLPAMSQRSRSSGQPTAQKNLKDW